MSRAASNSEIDACNSYRIIWNASFFLALMLALLGAHAIGQVSVTTWHYNNARTSANTSETILSPSTVSKTTFGKLATMPVDGYIVAHPLYLPNVSIAGGVHNVVYVATMHDSVYAFDADSASKTPLWMTSVFTYGPPGATTVPATVKKNAGTTGWVELGIISTPVIDPSTGTLYLVAETYENGAIVHRLHALDVSTGLEKLGGPTTIAATSTQNGVVTTFKDFYQMNRPGLLLTHGHIYIAWGSNGNNAYSQGWVMSYNAATLLQEGAYTAEPGKTLASIWQKDGGLSADAAGNIFAETAEGYFAAGSNLSSSIIKLTQSGTKLVLADWFTPYNQQYLSAHDLDLNNAVLVLPNQPGPYTYEAIGEGKEGTIYVLNRVNMGHYCAACTAGDTQIIQEIPQGAGPQTGNPVYWNNRVYFTGTGQPTKAYTIANGLLQQPPVMQPISVTGGGHAIITSNGNSNGILWVLSGNALLGLDAISLKTLYNSNATSGQGTVPLVPHFATPIAANGKLFIGTKNSLVVYGLFSGTASLNKKNSPRSPKGATLTPVSATRETR
jgi:PQQ-like domain